MFKNIVLLEAGGPAWLQKFLGNWEAKNAPRASSPADGAVARGAATDDTSYARGKAAAAASRIKTLSASASDRTRYAGKADV